MPNSDGQDSQSDSSLESKDVTKSVLIPSGKTTRRINSTSFTESSLPSYLPDEQLFHKSSRKKDTLTIDNITFKPESQWSESENCFVCLRLLGKIKLERMHHCRLCGKSVCGDCSQKKINDQRVCDVCFLLQNDQEMVEKKKSIMDEKTVKIKKYKESNETLRKQITKLEAEAQRLDGVNEKDKQNHAEKLESKNKLLNHAYKNMTKLEEDKREKTQAVKSKEKELNDKKAALDKIFQSMRILQMDIDNRRSALDGKKQEFDRLKKVFSDLEEQADEEITLFAKVEKEREEQKGSFGSDHDSDRVFAKESILSAYSDNIQLNDIDKDREYPQVNDYKEGVLDPALLNRRPKNDPADNKHYIWNAYGAKKKDCSIFQWSTINQGPSFIMVLLAYQHLLYVCLFICGRVCVCVLIIPLFVGLDRNCLLYTSPSPRDGLLSRMPSSA
eukprot:TRINITY_DN1947_c0_g2_i3.p1 TRINITY_DN1947_c0_g2~~TRINITY_DN1947_c0_g2_i3.p1  ORF type:complete len:444 (+),score=73.11 TRINITY_DN1947_c0_g2_i3:205-1536(+)